MIFPLRHWLCFTWSGSDTVISHNATQSINRNLTLLSSIIFSLSVSSFYCKWKSVHLYTSERFILKNRSLNIKRMADKITRIAIVDANRCKPKRCAQECKKVPSPNLWFTSNNLMYNSLLCPVLSRCQNGYVASCAAAPRGPFLISMIEQENSA